jgi:hypothetical protein
MSSDNFITTPEQPCLNSWSIFHYDMDWSDKQEVRAYHQKWRDENREKANDAVRRWRERNPGKDAQIVAKGRFQRKLIVISHYGPGGEPRCSWPGCNWNDVWALSIDHVSGGGNKHRHELGLIGDEFYKWLIVNGFPEGYQTLCMNHQFVKRHEKKEV